MLRVPRSGIQNVSNATVQALVAATAVQLQFPNSTKVPSATDDQSDGSVRADLTNHRVVTFGPGTYRVEVLLSGTFSANSNISLKARKKGVAVTTSPRGGPIAFAAGVSGQVSLLTEINVTADDLADGAGLASFPNPPQPGSTIGEVFAPKNGVPIDIEVTSSASGNLTAVDTIMTVTRVG